MYPKTIQKLIDLFSKFPGVGPKTAARFVFYLMKTKKENVEDLAQALLKLNENVKNCLFCFNPFEPSDEKEKICPICSNPTRDRGLLCVVEKEVDLASIEEAKIYNGLYFILGGTISTLKKEDIKKLRIKELKERIKNPEKFGILGASFREVILALNLTVEGQATALFLERELKKILPTKSRLTHLGKGLPMGGELEYADKETLISALRGRK